MLTGTKQAQRTAEYWYISLGLLHPSAAGIPTSMGPHWIQSLLPAALILVPRYQEVSGPLWFNQSPQRSSDDRQQWTSDQRGTESHCWE